MDEKIICWEVDGELYYSTLEDKKVIRDFLLKEEAIKMVVEKKYPCNQGGCKRFTSVDGGECSKCEKADFDCSWI